VPLERAQRHRRTFAYSHPEIPEYSVHDIVRIGSCKKKLQFYVDGRCYSIDEVPDDVELGEAQTNQCGCRRAADRSSTRRQYVVRRTRTHCIFSITKHGNPGVRRIIAVSSHSFQFSLHVLRGPAAALEHFEFLHEACSDPTERVADLLGEHIDPQGKRRRLVCAI
jgi:hypothetical protein